MRKIVLIFICCLFAIAAMSQNTLYYKGRTTGAVAAVTYHNGSITFNLGNQSVVNLPLTSTDGGFYMYNTDKVMFSVRPDLTLGVFLIVGGVAESFDLITGGNSYNSYGGFGRQGGTSGYEPAKSKMVCRACNGTGICGTCHGNGYFRSSYGGDLIACPNCSAANGRKCNVCDGTGYW